MFNIDKGFPPHPACCRCLLLSIHGPQLPILTSHQFSFRILVSKITLTRVQVIPSDSHCPFPCGRTETRTKSESRAWELLCSFQFMLSL